MRSKFWMLGLALVGCGTEPVAQTRLVPASTYSALGVARIRPEGGPPESIRAFRWQFTDVRTAAATAIAHLQSGSAEIDLEGVFDSDEHLLTFKDFRAPVTGTVAQDVVGMGLKISDGKPADGVGDEVSGYVEGTSGRDGFDGSFLAVSEGTNRPDPIDPSKLSAEVPELGTIRVTGAAGTVSGAIGLQLFRFTKASRNPELVNARADADGGFVVELEGISGDIVLVRANAAGNVSDAAAVDVP